MELVQILAGAVFLAVLYDIRRDLNRSKQSLEMIAQIAQANG